MESNGNLKQLEQEIFDLQDLKSKFLAKMNEKNKQSTRYWIRQIDQEIKKKLQERNKFFWWFFPIP